jgi:hypothetical protein
VGASCLTCSLPYRGVPLDLRGICTASACPPRTLRLIPSIYSGTGLAQCVEPELIICQSSEFRSLPYALFNFCLISSNTTSRVCGTSLRASFNSFNAQSFRLELLSPLPIIRFTARCIALTTTS